MGQVMDLVAHQTEALWSPSSGTTHCSALMMKSLILPFSGLPAWTMSGARHMRRGLLRVTAT